MNTLEKLKNSIGKRMFLEMGDGTCLDVALHMVFESMADHGRWIALVDNGKQQMLFVDEIRQAEERASNS